MVALSPQQKSIVQQIQKWFTDNEKPSLTLGGFAGTGKTTLIAYISHELRKQKPNLKIAFCSYTGKATRVLEGKLRPLQAVKRGDYIGTIHRLMYRPEIDSEENIIGWKRNEKDKFEYGLIIVDEASMVSRQLWYDLQTYQVPMLAVGDHGQLPPIDSDFNLMADPELKLEEIFRQSANHPIIELSRFARERGEIPFGKYAPKVWKRSRADPETQEALGELLQQFNEEMLVLVGYNHTRIKLNKAIRQMKEFESELPARRDRVICLKNSAQYQLYNGMLGEISSVDYSHAAQGYYEAEIAFDGEDKVFSGAISAEQFNSQQTLKQNAKSDIQLFDFGYALTVHKAQGSQARRVVLFEERFSKMDDDTWRRWLYTAVTRAEEELYIVA